LPLGSAPVALAGVCGADCWPCPGCSLEPFTPGWTIWPSDWPTPRAPQPLPEPVSETYGAFQIFSALNFAILAGWLVLAFGAWRTQVVGRIRALALALMAGLPLGVLKGTTPLSLVALAGLTAALLPLGIGLLRQGPRPSRLRCCVGCC
jgi:hypothetical protein